MKTIVTSILAICFAATALVQAHEIDQHANLRAAASVSTSQETNVFTRQLKGGKGGGSSSSGGGVSSSSNANTAGYGAAGYGHNTNSNRNRNNGCTDTEEECERSSRIVIIVSSVLASLLALGLCLCCIKYNRDSDDATKDQTKSVPANTSAYAGTDDMSFDERLEALRKEHQDTPTGFAKTAPKNGTYKYDYIENTDQKSGVAHLTFTDDASTSRYKISGTTKDADGVFTILEGSMTYDGSHMYWKEFQSGLTVLNAGKMYIETSTMVFGEWWADNQRKGRFMSFVLDESSSVGSNDETTTVATDNDNASLSTMNTNNAPGPSSYVPSYVSSSSSKNTPAPYV